MGLIPFSYILSDGVYKTRDLPTAKALWPEDFTVDYMRARLKKMKKRSYIFVVPFSQDGLYYRAKVISEVSPEKVCMGKIENTDKLICLL